MITCSVCNATNQAGALFCEMCGSRLAVAPAAPAAAPAAASPGDGSQCPTCGRPALPGEAFCDNCGTPLSGGPAGPGAHPAAAGPTPPAQPAPQAAYPAPTPIAGAAASTSCPSCGVTVVPGEAFCDNCGAALLQGVSVTPAPAAPPLPVQPPAPPVNVAPAQPAQPAVPAPAPPRPAPAAPAPAPAAGVQSLAGYQLVTASGTRISLPAKAEAVLGREDAPSNNYPEVDLGPHGALQEGVGRRHARMFVLAGQVQIEDLDSTNGTIVNRQKLPPRQGRVVNVGDEIRLGKLVLTLQR